MGSALVTHGDAATAVARTHNAPLAGNKGEGREKEGEKTHVAFEFFEVNSICTWKVSWRIIQKIGSEVEGISWQSPRAPQKKAVCPVKLEGVQGWAKSGPKVARNFQAS